MPNAISPDKQRLTYLENRQVAEWLAAMARERNTDLAVVIREATSAYFAQYRNPNAPSHFVIRSAAKAARRTETARRIASGSLTPEAAQAASAPLRGHASVRVVDLWGAVRRRAAKH